MSENNITPEEKNNRSSNAKLFKSGIVLEALPSTHFKVKLESGEEIIAHLAGKLRINRIKILVGDKVSVEMSPYDDKRGRIVYRGK